MVDRRAKRIARFIEPFKVAPGSKVRLGKDFDPGYRSDFIPEGRRDLDDARRLLESESEPSHDDRPSPGERTMAGTREGDRTRPVATGRVHQG